MSKPVKPVTFPCILLQQGKHKLVCFVAKARSLWELVDINERESDKDKGYQRALAKPRVAAITRYIKEGHPIPNAIIISLDPDSKISRDGSSITIPNRPNAGWVIDGQHRLVGAKEAENNIDLAVIAFIGLAEDQQAHQFVVINREAVGVPTSLYYDLKHWLPAAQSETEISKSKAVDIAKDLREDSESPLYNKIVFSSPKRGEISSTNFVRKVAPLLKSSGKFGVYTMTEQLLIIKNYFKALELVYPEEFHPRRLTFLKTLGFGAIVNVLPTVFDLTIKNHKGFTIGDIVKLLSRIQHFNFRAWDSRGSGTQAEVASGEEFKFDLMQAYDQPNDSTTIRL